MIPRTLRELIQVSRKTAREFKQALEEVAELIHEKQLEQSLQRQPARVPVRNQRGHGHPLAGNNGRRHFSTNRTTNLNFKNISLKFITGNIINHTSTSLKPSISKTFKAAVYQTQPFSFSTRSQLTFVRGTIGSGMYRHFPRHNSRMFSTFGPNLTHQVVENLSQNLRMFFLKGGKFSKDCLNADIGNSTRLITRDSDLNVDYAIELASRVSEISSSNESGCFVEFDLSTPSISSMIPDSGYFDESNLNNLSNGIENSISLKMKTLNDIKLFQENIGSTSFKYNKARNRLRLYCPNCDVFKMECLLQDVGISTGLVYKNNEINRDDESDSSSSEFSCPELESDNSLSSTSVESFESVYPVSGSISSSILSSTSSDVRPSDYYMLETTYGSILSSSDDYFDTSIHSSILRV